MAGKSTYLRNAFLKLMFNGSPIANLAENAVSGALPELYFALHTADPGIGGTQNASEASYGGYARQPVPRTGAAVNVVGNEAKLVADLVFPATTDGTTQTLRAFSVGVAIAGATQVLWSGPLDPVIPVQPGIDAPGIRAGTVVLEL